MNPRPAVSAPVVVVMGVAGSGKTTVGARLAEMLGVAFVEGDRFHPPANIAKMTSGEPLNDADRMPWLDAIAGAIDRARQDGRGLVVACSALKRAYREILIGRRPDVRLVYLRGARDLIGQRIGGRSGHFMPPSLLPSQFAALEEPGPAERPLIADVARPAMHLAAELAAALAPAGAALNACRVP